MPPLTLAEKILARKAGRASVSPGEIVEVPVDVVMAHEACAQSVKPFREMGATRVWDKTKIVIPIDHWVPASSDTAARLHKIIREFVREQGIPHFYDVGNHGICHQILAEEGFVLPGDLVVGSDSHTNMLGALGSFATGVGPTEIAAIFATGEIWLRVPESIRVVVTGRLRPPVSSKDVVLAVLRELTCEGALYRSVEFEGPAIEAMEMWERFTLTNMTTEMGAKTGIIAPDRKTVAYLRACDVKNGRRGEIAGRAGLRADPGATYEKTVTVDGSALEPLVAKPMSPDHVAPLREVEGTPVDQVFIGSCTNSRYEDLEIVAKTWRGKRVAPGCRVIVTPASTSIYKRALADGFAKVFTDAGAVFTSSSCGACFGGHGGIVGDGEVCASTTNRNFVGRMGHPGAKVYLMSPAAAAATALEGKIADPRRYAGRNGARKTVVSKPAARRPARARPKAKARR